MSFLASWWYGNQTDALTTDKENQTEAANSEHPTDASVISRVYIGELKQRLRQDCRAERSECRLDFDDQTQLDAYVKYLIGLQHILNSTTSKQLRADYEGYIQ